MTRLLQVLQGAHKVGLVVTFTVLATVGAGAQTAPATQSSELKDHLVDMMQRSAKSDSAARTQGAFSPTRYKALVARAQVAEANKQFRVAADDFALAFATTPDASLRDTFQLHLRAMIRRLGATGKSPNTAQVDARVTQALDDAFQQAYDRQIPVTKATPSSSGRVVVAEYITGTQCGFCWLHDRAYSHLLQRYAPTDLIVLAYHDSPGYPVVPSDGDTLWQTIAGGPKAGGLYTLTTFMGIADLGWIDGEHVTTTMPALSQASSVPPMMYSMLSETIDHHRTQPPGAQVAMTLTPSGVSDTGVATVKVDLRVTPSARRKQLGVRLMLVEDTVRVTGFTHRRLQYMAVRQVAWFGSPRSLFSPLPAESTSPTTLSYTFDVAALQRKLLGTIKADEEARLAFPDPTTWRMRPRHLGVVALVQDQDTKEVLQTAYQRILPGNPSR